MTTTFTTKLPEINTTFNTMYGPVTIPTIKAEDLKQQKFQFSNISLTTNALKYDEDKPPMNLLSREALEQTALVMAFGKQKYDAHNWRKGFQWSRPLSAAMRHIMAFNDGEDKDPESGLSHLAHAACCIMFLLEFEKTHKELDDRFKPIEQ
jgi:hypothetical protein